MRRIKLLSILALMLFCALGAKAEIHTVTWTDFSGEGAIYNSGECVSYSGDRIGGDLSDGRFYVNLSNDDYYIEKIEITCTSTENLSGDITGSAPTLIWEGHKNNVYFNGKINGVSKIVITIDGPVEVEDIFFESDEFNLNIGESVRLNATIIPENATYKDVTFESKNPEVATVIDNNLVVALSYGIAQIEATCGHQIHTLIVYVTDYHKVIIKEGTKDAENWSILPNPADLGSEVTIKYNGKKKVKSIKAVKKTVDVSEVTLNKSSIELFPGKTELLKASIMPEYASDKNVTWTSSDPSVATVEYGLVKAVKRGFTTITATVGGKSATCKVTVPATLADALTDHLMVIIYFKYSSGDNKCSYYNVGGTFEFKDGFGDVVNNAEMNKELIIENGNLVFKVCPGAFDSSVWQTHGFQITFNPTNNTYKVWRGSELDTYNNDFDMIYVDFHCIDLTEE